MELPSFNEFLANIDFEKLEYDLSAYSTASMKDAYNPFPKEQYELLVRTNLTMMRALLAQYHQWLSEKLSASSL